MPSYIQPKIDHLFRNYVLEMRQSPTSWLANGTVNVTDEMYNMDVTPQVTFRFISVSHNPFKSS